MTEYAVTTSNATNKVTAVAADSGATIEITLGDALIENGSQAAWAVGENTLIVKVTNGGKSTEYTVTVTKE